jgi:hypothetical protein
MAFKVYKRLTPKTEPFEYLLGTDNEAYTLGEALTQTSGRLTIAAVDTTQPEYICMKTQAAESTAATPIPVIRITDDIEFETTAGATTAVTLVGAKVTLGATALGTTATTTNGIFKISYTDGVTDGGVVRGYFKR